MLADSIFEQAATIETISTNAATNYAAKQSELVSWQDELMQSTPHLTTLIGGLSTEIMFDNHRNHARFMANAFLFNQYQLMARKVAWVYRSYHARGFSFDYFRTALPYWQQAVLEHLNSAEAAEVNRVYQWIIDHHDGFVQLAQTPEYPIFSLETDQAGLTKALLALLLQGDYQDCSSLALEVVKSESDLSEFYLQVLQPCMVEVGNLWESGAISVAQEHLVSATVQRMIAPLYSRYVICSPSKGKAIITATENEMHDIGARIVADLLEMDGWLVYYLGSNTPVASLIQMMQDVKPDLLGLSVVMSYNLESVGRTIAVIRKDEALQNMRIMVGGSAFTFAPKLWRRLGADGIAADGAAAVLLARNWWNVRHTDE